MSTPEVERSSLPATLNQRDDHAPGDEPAEE